MLGRAAADADPNADGNTYTDANSDADGDTYTDGHADADGNADSYSYSKFYTPVR